MGDRGNIAVVQSDNQQVWFYGHWSGWRMPAVLQHAIREGKGRWNDESYFARIVFCRLVPKSSMLETTSFGISTSLQDNENPIMVADCERQIVFTIEEDQLSDTRQVPKDFKPAESWTFEEYYILDKLPWGTIESHLKEIGLTKIEVPA